MARLAAWALGANETRILLACLASWRQRNSLDGYVLVRVPESALAFGFREDSAGVHDSRTIMLAELRALLAACPPSAGLAEYRAAGIGENVVGKATATTRHNTLRRLRQLYALDPTVPLFRALREL